MSIGPLRRLVGALGLVGMVPLLALVTLGVLSPVDAAVRSVVMLLGLLAIGRLVSWGVRVLAAEVESTPADEHDESGTRAHGLSGAGG